LIKQQLYLCAGVLAVAVGTVGIALPLLPTVPFMILAAYCFARSSPALEARLFTLNMVGSYAGYAAPGLGEGAVVEYARRVAGGLLAALATGCAPPPLIVASREGPAELVARLLEGLLRDACAPGGPMAPGGGACEALVLPGGRRPAGRAGGPGGRPLLGRLDRGCARGAPRGHATMPGTCALAS
jgi:hypothetical protein